jgi:hypothetical protein
MYQLTDWLTDRLVREPTDLLTDRLVAGLTYWLNRMDNCGTRKSADKSRGWLLVVHC